MQSTSLHNQLPTHESRANLQPKLKFLRFEFKYILPKNLRQTLEQELCHFLRLDPYVAAQPAQQYMVRSLYFDDPEFSNYYDKIDGLLHRAKFRLRTYTDKPEESCATFLELKGRYNALVFKHRVKLIPEEKVLFSRGEKILHQKILDTAEKGKLLEQFRYETMRKRIRPIMLIDYHRRPYFSKYDPEFRVTFDCQLHGTPSSSIFPNVWQNKRAIMKGYTIMEVKFQNDMPGWFHKFIKNYELKRVSVSKICKGIEAWNLTPKFL